MSSVLVKITKRRDHSGTGMQQLAEMSELVFFFFPFPFLRVRKVLKRLCYYLAKWNDAVFGKSSPGLLFSCKNTENASENNIMKVQSNHCLSSFLT